MPPSRSDENQNHSTLFTRRELIICLFLVIATFSVYWQVQNHEFINYDDELYVTENCHVRTGLTRENIFWAFVSTSAANWHPLTWLSHMLDCEIYWLNPSGHHWTSLEFHIANTLLLFLILRWMTGTLWQSALVAALFALHPLHVESVAWIAERKDVLSTFFWMLTIGAYIRYVKHPALNRYVLVIFVFILGLMSKPMLVTLPFALFLLDFWPLGRLRPGKDARGRVYGLVREKIPLFMLSAVSSVVTLLMQGSAGAIQSFEILPLKVRVVNALGSYAGYIIKMLWPHHLAVFYPHTGMLPAWQIAGSVILLVFISILVACMRQKRPWLIVGWLWYLGTLVPVIGLVQMGSQAMADRYTYVPLIGPFIMIAWGLSDLMAQYRCRRTVLIASSVAVFSILMVCTWFQVRRWQNSVTLFEHTIRVTTNNSTAHNNLGVAFARRGRFEEAIAQYGEALRIKPDYANAHNNLGIVLSCQEKFEEAISHYTRAIQIRPEYAEAHNNLGVAFTRTGKLKEAIDHFHETLKLDPFFVKTYNNLGNVLSCQEKFEEAIGHYTKAIQMRPAYAETHNNLGVALTRIEKPEEAIAHFKEALRLRPDYKDASSNLKFVLEVQRNSPEQAVKEGSGSRIGVTQSSPPSPLLLPLSPF